MKYGYLHHWIGSPHDFFAPSGSSSAGQSPEPVEEAFPQAKGWEVGDVGDCASADGHLTV